MKQVGLSWIEKAERARKAETNYIKAKNYHPLAIAAHRVKVNQSEFKSVSLSLSLLSLSLSLYFFIHTYIYIIYIYSIYIKYSIIKHHIYKL